MAALYRRIGEAGSLPLNKGVKTFGSCLSYFHRRGDTRQRDGEVKCFFCYLMPDTFSGYGTVMKSIGFSVFSPGPPHSGQHR